MASFKIEGGHKLNGTITPQGAKNEVLQILCAVLLTPERVVINNVPDIIDVNKLIFILGELGVKVEKLNKKSYSFQADEINLDYLESENFKRDGSSLRGSIMIVGPLLARFGRGYIPRPGGDKIGRRRLDTHFEGFIRLGAKFRYNKEEHFYGVEAQELYGCACALCLCLWLWLCLGLGLGLDLGPTTNPRPDCSPPQTRVPFDPIPVRWSRGRSLVKLCAHCMGSNPIFELHVSDPLSFAKATGLGLHSDMSKSRQ